MLPRHRRQTARLLQLAGRFLAQADLGLNLSAAKANDEAEDEVLVLVNFHYNILFHNAQAFLITLVGTTDRFVRILASI